MATRTRTHDDYTVGWVCALSKEQTAATAMLDEEHDCDLPKLPNDPNTYTLGSIGNHNIVIACLPEGEVGTNSAATIATSMISTFPSIKVGLMVGIGGGIPPKVRLGDVVVSTPTDQYPGVVQWDYGKAEEGGEFKQTGSLNNPPTLLRTALTKLKTKNEMRGSKIPEYLDELKQKWPRLAPKYLWSKSRIDPHASHNDRASQCPDNTAKQKAEEISEAAMVDADQRKQTDMLVHYGLIASGNQVIKDAKFRDGLDQRYNGKILCVEMEAAGLMNNFPCIVIRGICDYADSQKNKDWQEHAAAVAAAFAKELLQYVSPSDINQERSVRDTIKEVHNDVTYIRSKLNEKDNIKILDWLTQTDYGLQQSDIFNRRQPETGIWFLESAEFQDWLTTSKQSLFCPGMPGAGKTMLTSIVVNHLYLKFSDDLKTGIAYIYCNYKKQEEQNIYNLLASVLKQLGQSQPLLPESIKDLYNRHNKTQRTQPSPDEILTAIQSVILIYSRVFIIIDALDECQASDGCRSKFLSMIFNLQEKSGANLFVTSRFIWEITENFNWSKSLEIRASEHDVRRYIDGHISRLPSCVQRDLTLQEEVKTSIASAVDGMFLLAQLHFDSLIGKMTRKAVRVALTKLSSGSKAYDIAYNDAMDRINGQLGDQETLAKQILWWITCARRPLTTTELQHALAVEIGKSEFDEDNLPQIEDMLSICAGLVTVDEESQIIRLVHFTTQEYFDRTQGYWFPTAQDEIATVCVTYLSFSDFESGSCEYGNLSKRLKSFPFYGYAASNWGYHVPKDKASQEVIGFLESKAKVEASSQTQIFLDQNDLLGYIPKPSHKMAGIHSAGFFGLTKAVDTLLELGHSPNLKDSWNRGPLWYAVYNGHRDTIDLLLTRGANANGDADTYGKTALYAAAANGYQYIVKQLLAAGADVNARGHSAGQNDYSPLYTAAAKGYQEIVEQLLAAGADLNVTCSINRKTALCIAAENGHQDVVKQLLACGANVNSADPYERPALYAAAAKGHQKIVQQLLAAGANINAPSRLDGQTALHAAAEYGDQEVVKQLIAAGADVNAVSITYGGRTALCAAAGGGHQEVVKQLLAAGADTNTTATFQTALQEAANRGHQEVVKQLLAAGANTNAANGDKGTALQEAAENGHQEVVKQLIAAGADVNAAAMFKKTALQRAAENGHQAVVKQLLAAGADANADFYQETALQSAAEYGHQEVIKQLLAAGADVNITGGHRGTALQMAIRNNHQEAAKQLILAAANVNDTGGLTETALQIAAAKGYCKVIKQLLAAGANMNAANSGEGTALSKAIKNDHQEVIKQLLAAEADVNASNMHGETALHTAVEKGNKEIVEKLLAAGADVNAVNEYEGTALQIATRRGMQKIAEKLLAAGADEKLLAAEADVNDTASSGRTRSDLNSLGAFQEYSRISHGGQDLGRFCSLSRGGRRGRYRYL